MGSPWTRVQCFQPTLFHLLSGDPEMALHKSIEYTLVVILKYLDLTC